MLVLTRTLMFIIINYLRRQQRPISHMSQSRRIIHAFNDIHPELPSDDRSEYQGSAPARNLVAGSMVLCPDPVIAVNERSVAFGTALPSLLRVLLPFPTAAARQRPAVD
jgi:hypothetical protein